MDGVSSINFLKGVWIFIALFLIFLLGRANKITFLRSELIFYWGASLVAPLAVFNTDLKTISYCDVLTVVRRLGLQFSICMYISFQKLQNYQYYFLHHAATTSCSYLDSDHFSFPSCCFFCTIDGILYTTPNTPCGLGYRDFVHFSHTSTDRLNPIWLNLRSSGNLVCRIPVGINYPSELEKIYPRQNCRLWLV